MDPKDEANRLAAEALQISLLEWNEFLTPIMDSSIGIREKMLKDGWSPGVAEAIASSWMAFWTNRLLQSATEQVYSAVIPNPPPPGEQP